MINDEVKALAQGKNFATISTLLPKGQIQTHVIWVDCDDDHIGSTPRSNYASLRTSKLTRESL